MAPSSDQNSSTPTPTDPDLWHTPSPQSNSTLPATHSMNSHSPTPQTQTQEMAKLEQIWSGLSLGRSEDETVSYVLIPVLPRMALAWNQMTQTPSLPMRLKPPPQPTPAQLPRTHVRVRHPVHPYQAPVGHPRAPPVRQRRTPTTSFNMNSTDPLPIAIFRFLDLGEINIALREEQSNLYIIMFLNQNLPFVESSTHWARLEEVAPMYRIKTTTARHRCLPPSAARAPMTGGTPNDYLNPYTSSMKMIAWNFQGVGSVTFRNHTY